MATDLLQGIHLVHVKNFVTNDKTQKKLLQEIAFGFLQLCPGVQVGKVFAPDETLSNR